MSAYRRLTNRFCYGKRFLNVGGLGGGGRVLLKKATTLLVWEDFISNINSLNLTNLAAATTLQIAYRHHSHIKLWAYWSWPRIDFYASSTTTSNDHFKLIFGFGQSL